MGKKKYKKEILNALKTFGKAEHKILESMTQLMFLKEMKKSGVKFKKGDTGYLLKMIFSITVKIKTSGIWLKREKRF